MKRLPNEQLEKLKQQKYVAEKKLTAAKHKEKRLESEIKRLTRSERTHRLCTRAGMLETFLREPTVLTDDDVMELFYSLRSPYRKKAVWVLNDSTVKALRKLKDNTGNYIWNPSVQAGVPDTILNRPYKTSSYVPEIKAGNKCMAFGDFSYYWVADRQGRSFKRLNELFAMTGQVGFLASQRLDGKLILPEAVKTLTIKKA